MDKEKLIMQTWPDLNVEFENSLAQMELAVNRIGQLSAVARDRDEIQRKRRGEENVNSILSSLEEQSPAKFPIFVGFPPSSGHFLGRDKELDKILEQLDPVRFYNEDTVVAIFGLGGVGKTSLALAFAERCKSKRLFEAIIWIRSQTKEDMRACFNDIAYRLELPRVNRTGDNDDNIFLVRNWLGKPVEDLYFTYMAH